MGWKSWFRSLPSTAAGDRVIAIGDVHGRYDLLCELISRLEVEPPLPGGRTSLVFIGDLVDRGPHSRQVLHLVRHAQAMQPDVIVLKGNHEEAMAGAWRGDMDALSGWLGVGGIETLESFGVDPERLDPHRPDRALPLLRAAVPEVVIDWLDALPLWWRSGDYLLVHAGIRPGIPLERQDPSDLLWIRQEFLDHEAAHEAMIVHGHTVVPDVEIRDNRIGIDTGAYLTDRLSALCLSGTERRIVTTSVEGTLSLDTVIG